MMTTAKKRGKREEKNYVPVFSCSYRHISLKKTLPSLFVIQGRVPISQPAA
jgi:hypothetical protein